MAILLPFARAGPLHVHVFLESLYTWKVFPWKGKAPPFSRDHQEELVLKRDACFPKYDQWSTYS